MVIRIRITTYIFKEKNYGEENTQQSNNCQETINCINSESCGNRFHYDGWRVEDEGKSVIIKVAVDDKTKGEIFLPWEEIERIRQFGWERQKDVAKEKMHGKRVNCSHLQSVKSSLPECCQIGLNNGPHNVGCLDCSYIDGSIEYS